MIAADLCSNKKNCQEINKSVGEPVQGRDGEAAAKSLRLSDI